MQRIVYSSLAGVLAFFVAHASVAQTPLANREPGLWEIRMVDGSNLASIALGAQQVLKNLPEAQRRQVEQLMGGTKVQLPTVTQQCLTSEMARSDIKSQLAAHDIDCSELEWEEAGGSGRFSFVCTNPQGDWTGQGHIWDATAKSFKSEASVQGKYQGQRVSLDMKHEARWLGADCKGVKPPG